MIKLQQDLITLCDDILDDGEITPEEVMRLGKWFRANPDGRNGWPGELLADPVAAVCQDGKITKPELRRVARFLDRVAVELPGRRQDQVLEKLRRENAELVAKALAVVNLLEAELPAVAITVPVESQTDPGIVYQVELSSPSCTCPDWTGRRASLPVGNPSRCCKHIIAAFNRIRPKGGYPGWLDPFFGCNWQPHPDCRWSVLVINDHPSLISTPNLKGWANAYVMVDGVYQRYGYNVDEGRWAYARIPDDDDRIIRRMTGLGPQRTASSERPRSLIARLFGR